MNKNTARDQQARELTRVLRLRLNGQGSAEYDQFRAAYLTAEGERIAEQVEAHMDDDQILALCYRALEAGY